jgi:hypothetical protein
LLEGRRVLEPVDDLCVAVVVGERERERERERVLTVCKNMDR